MKSYGLPRDPDVECPSLSDISKYGRDGKGQTRRLWKKKARRSGEQEIKKQLEEVEC